MEKNIKFDNNNLLILHALPPKKEKGGIGCQSTQDLSTTSTNPINHNAPQQEIAEPIPAELIPENLDPQQNNYLGTNFNHADPKEPAVCSQQIHKPSTYVKQLQSGFCISDGRKNQLFFPKGLQTAKEGEEDTGAARIGKEMVEVGSMEFTMAPVIAEPKAMDSAMLEEVRRRMDWLKWDLVIKVELEALKKAELGELLRGRGGGILLCAKGYCTSRRMQLRRSSATRPDSLPKDSLWSMVWTIMKLSHLLRNSLPFEQYLPSLLTIIGPSTCSTSTVLFLTGDSMRMKKCS